MKGFIKVFEVQKRRFEVISFYFVTFTVVTNSFKINNRDKRKIYQYLRLPIVTQAICQVTYFSIFVNSVLKLFSSMCRRISNSTWKILLKFCNLLKEAVKTMLDLNRRLTGKVMNRISGIIFLPESKKG